MLSTALARAGLPDTPERRRILETSIETVRHGLSVLPADPAERAAYVTELRIMLGAYITERWGL